MVNAHGEETFAEAEELIKQKIPCENLSDDQLEKIGDYYMEQMHPGEAHEAMDEMMGGEGSESLRQMHIRMAKSFYCGDSDSMSSGMMGMMMGDFSINNKAGFGMMRGGNMMNFGTGMGAGWFGMYLLWLVGIAIAAFVFGIVFWWTYRLVIGNDKKKKTNK